MQNLTHSLICLPSSAPVASDWTVILGRLNQNGSNPFEMVFNVTNITLSNVTGVNVAVLLLQSRPTLNNYIQPICLDTSSTFALNTVCWAAGWSPGQGGGGFYRLQGAMPPLAGSAAIR